MTIHATEIHAMGNAPADLADIIDADVPAHAPDIAPHVADATSALMPDGQPADGANARQEAVWAALMANPGGSATEIGVAAGVSRVTASKILNGLEADGRALRTPGGHDGRGRTPDRWNPIADTPEATDESVPNAAETLTDSDIPGDLETAPVFGPDVAASPEPSTTTDVAPDEVTDSSVGDRPEEADEELVIRPPANPDGETEVAETDELEAEPVSVDVVPFDTELDTAPEWEANADEALDEMPHEDADELAVVEDPAWAQVRAELLELADLILGTVTAKDANDDAVLALGRLEMAMAKASQVHRSTRAVLTGTTTAPARTAARPGAGGGGAGGGVRPGALRDRVLDHLVEHPGKEFTPYEIGRVLDASSGAVANALDRLVSLGQAQLTCERPRRFALAVNPDPGD